MQVSHHATDEAEHNLEALADFVVDLKIVDVEEDEDGPELEQRQQIKCIAPPCVGHKAPAVLLTALPVPWSMRLTAPAPA